MEELKPCPFCGGDAEIDNDDVGVSWVICKSCGVSSDSTYTHEENAEANLSELWNNRPYEKEIERLKARLKASQEDNNKIRGRMHDQWIDQNKVKADAVIEAAYKNRKSIVEGGDKWLCSVDDLVRHANKLERGEK